MWKSVIIRLAWLFFLFSAVVFAPAWLFVLLVLVAIWHNKNFYEADLAGLFFDLLRQETGLGWWKFQFLATVLILVGVYLAEELKTRLRFGF